MGWLQITFSVNKEFAKDFDELLWEIGAISTSFIDGKDDPIYEPELDKVELWEKTKVVSLFDETVDPADVMAALAESGVTGIPYQSEHIQDQAWERAWMDQYHAMKFGTKLWICPSYQEVEEEGAVVVKLDPGLAFGTGTHPTTRMCLKWLDKLASEGKLQGKTILDYGSGSGVLSVAALKLGAKKVIAIDLDPQANQATLENAKENGVADKLEVYLTGDFNTVGKKVDIVVANILAGPLVELEPIIANAYNSNGSGELGLSGILKEKLTGIVQAYQNDFKLDEPEFDEEWVFFSGIRQQ